MGFASSQVRQRVSGRGGGPPIDLSRASLRVIVPVVATLIGVTCGGCAKQPADVVERTVTQTVTTPVYPDRPAPAVVLNVKDFGAQGDWKTNDTAAIQSALDAVGQNGAVIFFPPGGYLVPNGGLVSKNPVTLQGVKGLDGSGSRIMVSADKGVGFELNGQASVIDSLEIAYVPTTPTSMVGVVLNCNFGQMTSSRVTGFDTNLRISGTYYSVRDSSFRDFQTAGVEVNNPLARGDAGDGTITGSTFERRQDAPVGGSALLWLAGGGMRFIDNKINGEKSLSNGVTFRPSRDVSTTSLLVNSNSIENFRGAGIAAETGEGSIHNSVVISDNQIANYEFAPDSRGIEIDAPITNIVIEGNSVQAMAYGIVLGKVFHTTVTGNALADIRYDGITISADAQDVTVGQQSISVVLGRQIVRH